MKKKRLLSALLAVVTAFALMPIAAFAAPEEQSADSWDGTSDTSWYDAANPQESYTLTTAEQFAGLASLSETTDFKGITIFLGADLDLMGMNGHQLG